MLGPEVIDALVEGAPRRWLTRGEVLVRQGEPSDALHFVVSGRFSVQADATTEPFAEIGPGQPIGEIGFFAGRPRTATVTALRDSEVLSISRERFEELSEASPEIRQSVIVALANRLADARRSIKPGAMPRTLALVAAGASRLRPALLEAIGVVFGARGKTLLLTKEEVATRFPSRSVDDVALSSWLNAQEAEAQSIFYVADPQLTEWTKKCIRQADMILLVATAGTSGEPNEAERFALSVHAPSARRLLILHESRSSIVTGTAAWLKGRDVAMHHHVCLQDLADIERLQRFLSNRAVGFVAGGGGALGSAHLGVYKAFVEAGADFDILGGTSVGAAMTGALALGADPDKADAGTHAMFVKARSFRRFTLPYFGILNHKVFDSQLSRLYGEVAIEDLWRPFFAVSANLSNSTKMVHRQGSLWRAIRASSSIPALLPPYLTEDGEMLVDGGIVDNVPLAAMKAIKTGPNLVVQLNIDEPRRHAISYDSIPGPVELGLSMLIPRAARRLREIPSIIQVMTRSVSANRQRLLIDESDLLVQPAFPEKSSWSNWDSHSELMACAYRDAVTRLGGWTATNDPLAMAVIGRKP